MQPLDQALPLLFVPPVVTDRKCSFAHRSCQSFDHLDNCSFMNQALNLTIIHSCLGNHRSCTGFNRNHNLDDHNCSYCHFSHTVSNFDCKITRIVLGNFLNFLP